MTVIALLPVRNEAWILPHSLACLSGFCDVVIVCDQESTDTSREVCRRFPKVVVLDQAPATDSLGRLPQSARWKLLDAARQYDGTNLIWISDADELVPPVLARQWVAREADRLTPGTVVECLFYNLWNGVMTYRDDTSLYRPHWKPMAFVDDRHVDYSRSPDVAPLHEPRLPLIKSAPTVRADDVPVMHLQWLVAERNQMKQAWYRCIELIDGRASAAEINRRYSITLPAPAAATTSVPAHWVAGVTFPDFAIDGEPTWQQAEVLEWFDQRGVGFFEPLEIWHVPLLRDEFRRRMRRAPRPDRSYRPRWSARARQFSRRVAGAAWRRVAP